MLFDIFRRSNPWIIVCLLLAMLFSPLRLINLYHIMLLIFKRLLFIKLLLNFLRLSLQMPNQQFLRTGLLINLNLAHIMSFRKILIRSRRPIFISKILQSKFVIPLPCHIELRLDIIEVRLIHRRLEVLRHQESLRDVGNMVLVHVSIKINNIYNLFLT